MATLAELREKWEARRADGERLGTLAPIASLAADILADLQQLATGDDTVLTIAEAARLSGYSADHLRREILHGRIPNGGRKRKPGIRRADVPRKPGHPLPGAAADATLGIRRRIVLEATNTPRWEGINGTETNGSGQAKVVVLVDRRARSEPRARVRADGLRDLDRLPRRAREAMPPPVRHGDIQRSPVMTAQASAPAL